MLLVHKNSDLDRKCNLTDLLTALRKDEHTLMMSVPRDRPQGCKLSWGELNAICHSVIGTYAGTHAHTHKYKTIPPQGLNSQLPLQQIQWNSHIAPLPATESGRSREARNYVLTDTETLHRSHRRKTYRRKGKRIQDKWMSTEEVNVSPPSRPFKSAAHYRTASYVMNTKPCKPNCAVSDLHVVQSNDKIYVKLAKIKRQQ